MLHERNWWRARVRQCYFLKTQRRGSHRNEARTPSSSHLGSIWWVVPRAKEASPHSKGEMNRLVARLSHLSAAHPTRACSQKSASPASSRSEPVRGAAKASKVSAGSKTEPADAREIHLTPPLVRFPNQFCAPTQPGGRAGQLPPLWQTCLCSGGLMFSAVTRKKQGYALGK